MAENEKMTWVRVPSYPGAGLWQHMKAAGGASYDATIEAWFRDDGSPVYLLVSMTNRFGDQTVHAQNFPTWDQAVAAYYRLQAQKLEVKEP